MEQQAVLVAQGGSMQLELHLKAMMYSKDQLKLQFRVKAWSVTTVTFMETASSVSTDVNIQWCSDTSAWVNLRVMDISHWIAAGEQLFLQQELFSWI